MLIWESMHAGASFFMHVHEMLINLDRVLISTRELWHQSAFMAVEEEMENARSTKVRFDTTLRVHFSNITEDSRNCRGCRFNRCKKLGMKWSEEKVSECELVETPALQPKDDILLIRVSKEYL